MPTLGDLFRAQDTPTELVGPPEPPKPKTLGDLFRAQDAASQPPDEPKPTRKTRPTSVSERFIAGMVQRGWTPAEAAAAAGNIHAESGFDPGIQERRPIAGRGGFGFLQWTGPRRRALERFAQLTGRSLSDPELQMDFLHAERTGESTRYGGPDERRSYRQAFPEGGGPRELAYRFGAHVERPANLAASAETRTTAARQFASGEERIGYPSAAPKPKTLGDLFRAQDATPEPPPPTPGAAGGAALGDVFRRDKERAEIPELLRRPEEPEPEPPPLLRRPPDEFEPPPLLKRPAYEEAPPGAYGKPTRLEEAALYATRFGVPILAGIGAGALSGAGAPVVGPLVGASAATATELGLQKYEKARGLREDVSPGGVVLQGALGGFQGVPLSRTLTAPARFGARTLEGTAVGTGATTLGTLIEEGRMPTAEELAWGAGTGAAFGAVGGGLETKGVPYLHERSPSFVGPREFQSGRQLRATRKALATSADQLAGETTLPPTDAPRMVTEPGETIGPEPVQTEFVGPLEPEMTPHPVGSDVQFRELGEQERITPGRIVSHELDPETGETRIAVETDDGFVRQRPMDDVELTPGRAVPDELVGPPTPEPVVGGEMRPETAFEPPPDEMGPYGQRPTFRKYPGLGEALTGEEIEPQRAADPARMTRAIESIDREFSDVFDEPTRERLKQQVRDNEARFEYLGRGKQTVARTKGLARDLVFDLDAAKLEPKGETWNAEKTQAAKNHVAALDQTIQDAQAAYDADPTPQNGLVLQKAVQDQVDAFTIFRARGAEAGRTLNIFKASAEELASGNQGLLMAALRRGVPPEKLAEIIRNTEPRDVQARAEMLMASTRKGPWHSRAWDVAQTFFISNLLSGFGPHERNILGNSVRAVATPATRPFSAAIERYVHRVPHGERTIYAGQSVKEYAAVKDSLWEASVKALEVLRRGYTTEQAAKFDLPTREIGQGMHPTVRMGLNIIPRLLSTPDMFFRVLAQHASENGQAYTKARNQAMVEAAGQRLPPGLSFVDRLDQLYDHHRANLTPEMIEAAGNDAATSVYQEHSNLARMLQQARRDYPPLGFVMPFTTTSTNIGKQMVHHTPFGFAMPSTWGRGMEGGARARQALTHQGEALAGTVATALTPLAVYAAGGKIHGHGPDDPKEFAVWRQTHTPNSIEIGGHAMDVTWLGLLAAPLLLVGNAWDEYEDILLKEGDVSPADADRIVGAAVTGGMQSMLDMPYLDGVANLIDVIRHPKQGRAWHKLLDGIGLGFVPGIGFQRWLEQIEDPTIREAKTFGEKVQAATPDIPGTDIPLMPFGRSVDLPPRLDEFGQPIEIKKPLGEFGRAVIPFAIEPVRRDPLRDELAKFGMTLSPPSAGTPEQGEPPYTPKEGLVIRQAKGQQVRAELEDLIASDAYQEADPEDQLTMLKSVLGRTRGVMGKRARGLREEGLDVESLRWGE
jgi:Phage tail lysozyme